MDIKFSIACTIIIAYFIADYIADMYWVCSNDTLMRVHHIVGCLSTAVSLFAGYALNGIANMLLLMESSTIAINYRAMYKKEELGGPGP